MKKHLAVVLPRLKLKRRAKFIYNTKLDSCIWCPDGQMNKLASNALQLVAWNYIRYLQHIGFPLPDNMIHDIFVHGSTSNYYYDDTSDIDICIVADLSKMRETFNGVDIYVLLKSALGSWLRNYRIRICGRGVDIEVADVNNPRYAENVYKVGSAYSLARDSWIRRPQLLKDDEVRTIRRAARVKYREIRRMYHKICHDKMAPDFIETFLARLTHERKESYAGNFMQPITAETMAFRMARRCGILRDLRERAMKQRSRDFNLSL